MPRFKHVDVTLFDAEKKSPVRRYDGRIAKAHGIYAAVLFQSFTLWALYSRSHQLFGHEGLWWTYRSVESIHSRHPEFSVRRIIEGLAILKSAKLVLARKGLFKVPGHPNVIWYSLGSSAASFLPAKTRDLLGLKAAEVEPIAPRRIVEAVFDEVSS